MFFITYHPKHILWFYLWNISQSYENKFILVTILSSLQVIRCQSVEIIDLILSIYIKIIMAFFPLRIWIGMKWKQWNLSLALSFCLFLHLHPPILPPFSPWHIYLLYLSFSLVSLVFSSFSLLHFNLHDLGETSNHSELSRLCNWIMTTLTHRFSVWTEWCNSKTSKALLRKFLKELAILFGFISLSILAGSLCVVSGIVERGKSLYSDWPGV